MAALLLMGIAFAACGGAGGELNASDSRSSAPKSDSFVGDWKETGQSEGMPSTTIHVGPPQKGEHAVTWSFGEYGDASITAERKSDAEYVAVQGWDGTVAQVGILTLAFVDFELVSETFMEVSYSYGEETLTASFEKSGAVQ